MTCFNRCKKYVKVSWDHRNRHKTITLGYVLGVSLAFIISVAQNSDVNASTSSQSELDYLLLENNIKDSSNVSYTTTSSADLSQMFNEIYYSDKEKIKDIEVIVKNGDNIIKILTDLGMEYNEANSIVAELKKVFDIRALRVGQKIIFSTVVEPKDDSFKYVKSFVIPTSSHERVFIERDENAKYASRAEKDTLIEEINNASGLIEGTLGHSMTAQGVPTRTINEFINIFAFSLDFRRDVHKGDKFEIIYENFINGNGEIVKTGKILYAALQLRKDKIALYRYEDSKGSVDYFDEKGFAMKKTLDRKPISFKNARVSSPFGKRRHPIHRDIRIHWGVDYAAPRGTAIYAAGDGVVQEARYFGGYGKYVKIRHNSQYSTAYGHMHGYAKGIAPGVRVKQGQIIGYVGSTGNSTGNHLHYEVVQYGRRVNPLNIKASASESLKGQEFEKFKQVVANIKDNHKNMFAMNE